jgi:transcriptional regulator with XRE-family HTH domain
MDDKHLYEQIGRRIAGYRRALDLKQEDVAKRLGISRASLANMEVGRQRLLVHQLYGLAEALDLRGPEDLLPRLLKKGASAKELPISGAELSETAREQLAAMLASD